MHVEGRTERLKARLGLCAAILAAFAVSGCEFLGPRALEAGRMDYNAAAKSTAADQLLLNIARMRFNDRPYFLEVASISSTAEAGAAFGGTDELADKDYLLFAAGDVIGGDEIVIAVDPRARETQNFVNFTRILNLDPEASVYRMRVGVLQNSSDEIAIKTCPIKSALFFVDQGKVVPEDWIEGSFVNFAVDSLGNPFNWDQVHGDLILIKSSLSEPPDLKVYSKVFYSERWFYIEVGDVDSKKTLTMLSVVLTLKAGGIKTERPVLTLPVGG